MFIILVVVMLVTQPTFTYAATGWKATDSAAEYGLSTSLYPGNDDPDNVWYIYAPAPRWHDQFWYDYDNPSYADWVWDGYMNWYDGARQWFLNNTYYNLCWEERSYPYDVYEALDTIYTDLPNINHNEDSAWYEEIADGYEEKEVGTWYPENINVYRDYYLYTAWEDYGASGRFESETELTQANWISPLGWYPVHWDQNGKMWWADWKPPIW